MLDLHLLLLRCEHCDAHLVGTHRYPLAEHLDLSQVLRLARAALLAHGLELGAQNVGARPAVLVLQHPLYVAVLVALGLGLGLATPSQVVRAEAYRRLDLGDDLRVQVRLVGHGHARQLGADRLRAPEVGDRLRPSLTLQVHVAHDEPRVSLRLERRTLVAADGAELREPGGPLGRLA